MFFPSFQRKRYHGILLDAPRDDDNRCQECGGVCCSSFAAVDISWNEYERLRQLGARRLQLSLFGPHKLDIDSGCEFLVGGRCSIYDARPDICRRFFCSDV